ncbi:MAG: 3'(2'),5'-bisphosphate nucleotidase CysQ [Gemmatimonadaceae bacterium]
MSPAPFAPNSPEGLAHVTAMSLKAGRAIMTLYASVSSFTVKADRSPVTAADHASNAVLVAGLQAAWPDIPIVSEEDDFASREVRRGWHRFWLVDPLDGTKEYLARNDEFTVNVALIEGGEPTLGVVHAPALDVTYTALTGHGAWRTRNGGPAERIFSKPQTAGSPLVVVESRSHPSAELEAWITTMPVTQRVQAGSSLKLCWVADGQATVYPRFGPTMEWDVAAGDCIYRNAAVDGAPPSPLRYNKPALRNDNFILGL